MNAVESAKAEYQNFLSKLVGLSEEDRGEVLGHIAKDACMPPPNAQSFEYSRSIMVEPKYREGFPYTVGLELAYITTNPKVMKDSCGDMDLDEYDSIDTAEAVIKEQNPHLRVHEDCGALEFPSPVFGDYYGVKNFYDNVRKAIHGLPLAPQHSFEFEGQPYQLGSAGGHIHYGIPKDLKGAARNRFNMNAMIFSQNNLVIGAFFRKWFAKLDVVPYVRGGQKVKLRQLRLAIKKGCRPLPMAVRLDTHEAWKKSYDTIEFRCFETPETLDGLNLHLNFGFAVMKYVDNATRAGKTFVPQMRGRNIFALRELDKARDEIRHVFDLLEMDYERYAHFEANLEERIGRMDKRQPALT